MLLKAIKITTAQGNAKTLFRIDFLNLEWTNAEKKQQIAIAGKNADFGVDGMGRIWQNIGRTISQFQPNMEDERMVDGFYMYWIVLFAV